ncbi:MAG: serine/threonine protein kinase [Planctomycetota bacterium]|nr:MAG: serine/threonine protein kinase [Planctomycetota bacterium]
MSAESEKRKIGPFQIEDKLGVGGMGIVYRATYIKTGQVVALKALAPELCADPKVAKRFEREMEILKKLKHPNIIKYYGGVSTSAQQFYAMELLSGGGLDVHLRKAGRFTWQQTIDYALQIAKALEYAHNAGIVHRDLKPANLLLAKDGTLKLTDFGIARDSEATQLTQAGKTVGTLAYMAPEQITGKSPITRRTDLYALGCLLFQMMTGRTPFESATQPELLFKHIEEEPPSVREFNPDCPRPLESLIAELMEKDPNDRPFDALSVQVRLEEIIQKVAEQEEQSKTRAADAAGATVADATKALKKKKKKKVEPGEFIPVYERTWFYASCLVALIGVVIWFAWPESLESQHARCQEAMKIQNFDAITDFGDIPEYSDWLNHVDEIDSILKDYPNTPQAVDARRWKDMIEMVREDRLSQNNVKFDRVPKSDAERAYVNARKYEKFGDSYTAIEKYEAMQTLIESTEESRPFLNLARHRAELIRKGADNQADRTAYVEAQLKKADDEFLQGDKVQAREKWQSIVKLYSDSPVFASIVARAKARVIDAEGTLKAEAQP